jgi:epoxyqueuosine reductase
VIDANRCLSTWTIEWRGRPPSGKEAMQGTLIFGCDICQAVCPWNRRAARAAAALAGPAPAQPVPPAVASAGVGRGAAVPSPQPEYGVDPAHAEIGLADLFLLSAGEHRRRFRRSPLWRAHPEGMRRNALIVAANAGRVDLAAEVARVGHTDPDPVTRVVAQHALARLEQGGRDRKGRS